MFWYAVDLPYNPLRHGLQQFRQIRISSVKSALLRLIKTGISRLFCLVLGETPSAGEIFHYNPLPCFMLASISKSILKQQVFCAYASARCTLHPIDIEWFEDASTVTNVPTAIELIDVNITCSGEGESPCSSGSTCLEGDLGVYCECYPRQSNPNEVLLGVSGCGAIGKMNICGSLCTLLPNCSRGPTSYQAVSEGATVNRRQLAAYIHGKGMCVSRRNYGQSSSVQSASGELLSEAS